MANRRSISLPLAAIYAALVVYGSLYPFSNWQGHANPLSFIVTGVVGATFSTGDMLTNVFAYLPLGFFLYRGLTHILGAQSNLFFAVLVGVAMSFSMEFLQAFLPSRNPSALDWLLNSLGTLGGAFMGSLPLTEGRLGRTWLVVRNKVFLRGSSVDLGLIGVGAWMLSETFPLVPSIDLGKFRTALSPILRFLESPDHFNGWSFLSQLLTLSGLTLLTRTLLARPRDAQPLFLVAVAAVMLLQIPVMTRTLSPEMVVATLGVLISGVTAPRMNRTLAASVAFTFIFAGFCIGESLASASLSMYRFNWIPFRTKLSNPLTGMASLLEMLWVGVTLAYCARVSAGQSASRLIFWWGGALLVLGSFLLEANQRIVPGRSGDITMPLLLGTTWLLAWRVNWTVADPQVQLGDQSLKDALRESWISAHRAPIAWRYAGSVLTFLVLIVAFYAAPKLPGVPYNVRELIWAGHPLQSALALALTAWLSLVAPAWWATRMSLPAYTVSTFLPAIVAIGLLSWSVLKGSIGDESFHDVVGSPVLGWPEPVEITLRFLALHAALSVQIAGAALLAMAMLRRRGLRRFLIWLVLSLILAPVLHWVIVSEAATDNLTELMGQGGRWPASTYLALALFVAAFSGSALSLAISQRRRVLLGACIVLMGGFISYVLINLGTEPALIKDGKVFSALQFALSPDRSQYASGISLTVRYALAYGGFVLSVVFLQYPIWRNRFGSESVEVASSGLAKRSSHKAR